MEFQPTSLPDVILIKPRIFADERGFFLETWHRLKFRAGGIDADFVQDNHSRSIRHTLRGLHYQIRQPQGKLVRVTEGEIYDVAVDLRRDSASFGHWTGVRLSAENRHMLWIPPGFAHGFLVLSDTAEMCYKCSDYYAPEHERSLLWNDTALQIDWPIPEGVDPILSDKDRAGQILAESDVYETGWNIIR